MLCSCSSLWARCCDEFSVEITRVPPGLSVLAYVFSRLGADSGTCIRGM